MVLLILLCFDILLTTKVFLLLKALVVGVIFVKDARSASLPLRVHEHQLPLLKLILIVIVIIILLWMLLFVLLVTHDTLVGTIISSTEAILISLKKLVVGCGKI